MLPTNVKEASFLKINVTAWLRKTRVDTNLARSYFTLRNGVTYDCSYQERQGVFFSSKLEVVILHLLGGITKRK